MLYTCLQQLSMTGLGFSDFLFLQVSLDFRTSPHNKSILVKICSPQYGPYRRLVIDKGDTAILVSHIDELILSRVGEELCHCLPDFCYFCNCLSMVELLSSSSVSTGRVVPLRVDWAIFCHAGKRWVGRVSQGKNPLKYTAPSGNWTRATERTDSEIHSFSHWAIMTVISPKLPARVKCFLCPGLMYWFYVPQPIHMYIREHRGPRQGILVKWQ